MCGRNSSVVRVVKHLRGKVFDTASPSRLHMPPDATFCLSQPGGFPGRGGRGKNHNQEIIIIHSNHK